MKKWMLLAIVAAIICVSGMAIAEPAQVDYDSMTLEEVKMLADEASAYYREQTTVPADKAREARALLTSALESMFPGQTISGPMFGFDVKRARTVYTIDDSFSSKLEKQKKNHSVHARFDDDGGLKLTELIVDGSATEVPDQRGNPTQDTANARFNAYGDQLDMTELDGVCVLKYRIQAQMTNKQTINQNYYTVVNFIKDGGGDQYREIQYWAVAKMTDGSESKVISFTVPKDLIDKIKSSSVLPIELGDYVTDLWILPSLSK